MEGSWENKVKGNCGKGGVPFKAMLGVRTLLALTAGQEACWCVQPRGWQWPWACPVFLSGGPDGNGYVFLKLLC